jgi:hypothetical protein
LLIDFIGSNDVLHTFYSFPGFDRPAVTPEAAFAAAYLAILRQLKGPSVFGVRPTSRPRPSILIGKIPDVTKLPLFVPVNGEPMKQPGFDVLIGYKDKDGNERDHDITPYLPKIILSRKKLDGTLFDPNAVISLSSVLLNHGPDIVEAILKNPRQASYTVQLLSNEVIDPKEMASIEAKITGLNDAIETAANRVGGITVVQTDTLFRTLERGGITFRSPKAGADPITLDLSLQGGAVSFDGIHPTKVGQAVIAKQCLWSMQRLFTDFGGFTTKKLLDTLPPNFTKVLTVDLLNPKNPA